MEVFKRQILKYLAKHQDQPLKVVDIARGLGIPKQSFDAFATEIKDLHEKGVLKRSGTSLFCLAPMKNRVVGTFRANAKGFGFVIPLEANAHGDLFIDPDSKGAAMSGDTVAVRVVKNGFRGGQMRYNGVIVEIIERGTCELVGTLKRSGPEWIVAADSKGFIEPIVVDDITAKGAKPDDKVVVEIVRYPTQRCYAQGVILEVLGRAGLYDVELKAIIKQYQLPGDFEDDCKDQARKASSDFDPDSATTRDDITAETIVTIDPPDARDFDDAISLRRNKDGNWVLGIHIADVSTFIPMESPLDKESRERGNSIYLPGKVIPMLPEVLSNGICSLQPDKKRFAKTAYITYDDEGKVLGSEFANSIIKSSARLTYLQADQILKGNAKDFDGNVVALVKDMDTLARAIEKRRVKKGMLKLDLPEIELVLDDDGKVIDAEPADDCFPHTIIEMFMVEANEAVASLLDRFNVPFMRRIHPEPEADGLKDLGRYVKLCGMKIPRKLDRYAIQNLLDAVKGTSNAYAINTHILRSLQRAEYSPMHIGHFALASQHYAHFTSPIRRYADLLVHRLIQCVLDGTIKKIGLEEVLPELELTEIGNHISNTEKTAQNAERELKTVMLLEMLSDRIGDQLDCIVSGLTKFGVFVRCMKYGIEGLIKLEDLGLDEWKYSERTQSIQGVNSGKSVHLGDSMIVRIVSVNVPGRFLDIVPAEPLANHRCKKNTSKKAGRGRYRPDSGRRRKSRRR